ncbi:MAG TPA: DinB family protein [Candidatus Limnocylindria bacterium]|nr:DinB family protein [Candidatus Limnocylindria bacterium]
MSIRDQTLADMRASWEETEAILARIPADRMLEPGVTDEWSVRDLLAHIAGYERYVSALIFGDLEGRTPTNQQFYGRDDAPTPEDDANDDTSNAWVVAHARTQPLEATLDEYRWAHGQMIEAVKACSDADLENPSRFPSLNGKTLLAILPGQCMGHHREHNPQLQAFADRL